MAILVSNVGAKAVVRLDKMQATYAGNIESVKFYDATNAPAAIENGRVVALAGLVSGERDIMKGVAPAAASDKVVLVAGVELMADQTVTHGVDEYENPANKPFRAFHLYEGDIFSVSYNALDLIGSAPVVGNFVAVQAGSTKLKEYTGASLPADAAFVGKIIATEKWGIRQIPLAVIQVIKA